MGSLIERGVQLVRRITGAGRAPVIGEDGLPIPPPELHFLVSGSRDLGPADFLAIGKGCADGIMGMLKRRGLAIEDFRAVLDFGCGCGRVIRHFRSAKKTKLYGSDYNPRLVDWCAENLPFAEFGVNQLRPPLRYADAAFDFIYAFSVLTHLPEDLAHAWMNEFRRVLKPGGYLLLSMHGSAHAKAVLADHQRLQFDEGRIVVLDAERAGENACAVFHPPETVRQLAGAAGFEVLEFEAGRATAHSVEQDTYLVRKID